MEIALDTNAYSDWIRRGLWRDVISGASRVWLPSVVIGELYRGFYCGNRAGENEALLREVLGQPEVGVLSIGLNEALVYGELLHYLRGQGTPLPVNDIWIAAACVEHGCTLVTSDKHFEQLPQVRLAKRNGV